MMLGIGVTVVVISTVCWIILCGIIVVIFLTKSPPVGKALGEVFTAIALGGTSTNYVRVLEDAGLKPTRWDKLLDRVQKCLMLLLGGGLILILVSFALNTFE
jgi:hypothetical protein